MKTGTRRLAVGLVLLLLCTVPLGCPPPSGEGEGEGEGAATEEVTLAAEADTTLFENSTGSLANGAGSYLFTGRTDQGYRRRLLIRFDVVAALPAGATVVEARLRLHMSRTLAGVVRQRVFLAPEPWGEGASDAPDMEGTGTSPLPGDATWLHTFYPDTRWAVAGGGVFPVAEARAALDVGANGSYEFSSAEMAQDVQDWLDGALENDGWIMLGDESAITNAKRWDSRENEVIANRPVLVVTYRP